MTSIKNGRLFILNLIFASPVVVLLLSYTIAFLGRIVEVLYTAYTPIFIAYYLAPFIGWGSIIPIITCSLGIKAEKKIFIRILYSILALVYMAILVYTIWWWVTGQRFEAI